MSVIEQPPPPTSPHSGAEQRLHHVRTAVRQFLSASPAFAELAPEDRTRLARSMVNVCHTATELIRDEQLAKAQSKPPARPLARAMITSGGAGSSVANIAGTTQAILKAVSFPRFVADLINGVFRALLECNTSQMESYVQLLNNVATSVEGFADTNLGPDRARRWLAEQFPSSYEIITDAESSEPPTLRLRDGASAPSEAAMRTALGLNPGDPVPSPDAEEELIPAVRAQLARQRQQMLASMVMLGMQRIVIDSGRIDASMRYHIDASSAAASEAGTRFDTNTSIGASGSFGFGPWGASANIQSNIGYVSTSNTQASEETNAAVDVGSAVSVIFRTDQVPLDHLASQQRVELIKANTINPMASSVVNPPNRPSLRDGTAALRDSLKPTIPTPAPTKTPTPATPATPAKPETPAKPAAPAKAATPAKPSAPAKGTK